MTNMQQKSAKKFIVRIKTTGVTTIFETVIEIPLWLPENYQVYLNQATDSISVTRNLQNNSSDNYINFVVDGSDKINMLIKSLMTLSATTFNRHIS